MSSEEKEENGFKISLDKLSSKEAIPIWLLNARSLLDNALQIGIRRQTFQIQPNILSSSLPTPSTIDPFDARTIWQQSI
jgi:hypothetical protein